MFLLTGKHTQAGGSEAWQASKERERERLFTFVFLKYPTCANLPIPALLGMESFVGSPLQNSTQCLRTKGPYSHCFLQCSHIDKNAQIKTSTHPPTQSQYLT